MATFGQILDELGILFISTSGHTDPLGYPTHPLTLELYDLSLSMINLYCLFLKIVSCEVEDSINEESEKQKHGGWTS